MDVLNKYWVDAPHYAKTARWLRCNTGRLGMERGCLNTD